MHFCLIAAMIVTVYIRSRRSAFAKDGNPALKCNSDGGIQANAFGQAQQIIAGMRGYRSHSLSACLERPGRYLLLVEWESLEDHTEGFRQSTEYQQWRDLLHHFYEPFPEVEHYEPVFSRDWQ